MSERNKKILIIAALFSAIAIVMFARNLRYTADTEFLQETSEQQVNSNLPLLLELGSDSCIPCKKMMPILKQLKTKYGGKLRVQFIDVMKDRKAVNRYQISVIPTQIFYDVGGNELFRHEGFFPKEDILIKWRKFGVELEKEDD
jgi:thioredoxin 1